MIVFLVQTLWANEFSCGMMYNWDEVRDAVEPEQILITSDVKLGAMPSALALVRSPVKTSCKWDRIHYNRQRRRDLIF